MVDSDGVYVGHSCDYLFDNFRFIGFNEWMLVKRCEEVGPSFLLCSHLYLKITSVNFTQSLQIHLYGCICTLRDNTENFNV